MSFSQAAAENLHLAAASYQESNVIIFSNGSSLYIFPENLELMLRRLRRIPKTVHVIFSEPNSQRFLNRTASAERSKPGAPMGYDHDYSSFGKLADYQIVEERISTPYPSIKYASHQADRILCMVHLKSPKPI